MEFHSLHFYSEPIDVQFITAPLHEKSPSCPDSFTWREKTYRVVEMLSQWTDYTRKGRMARNMQPQHAAVASTRGSWGVGRFYFLVRIETGQVFEIYYDRAPKDADTRKGSWVLVGEYAENQSRSGDRMGGQQFSR